MKWKKFKQQSKLRLLQFLAVKTILNLLILSLLNQMMRFSSSKKKKASQIPNGKVKVHSLLLQLKVTSFPSKVALKFLIQTKS